MVQTTSAYQRLSDSRTGKNIPGPFYLLQFLKDREFHQSVQGARFRNFVLPAHIQPAPGKWYCLYSLPLNGIIIKSNSAVCAIRVTYSQGIRIYTWCSAPVPRPFSEFPCSCGRSVHFFPPIIYFSPPIRGLSASVLPAVLLVPLLTPVVFQTVLPSPYWQSPALYAGSAVPQPVPELLPALPVTGLCSVPC